MKGKNKKTKAVAKKVAVKAVKIKKAVKKVAPKARSARRLKEENLLGSIAKPQTENLGTKILVQEITEEPRIFPLEVPLAEEVISQNDLIDPQEEVDGVVAEEFQFQEQADDQPQVQSSAEQYYMQKEMSPRQKNIIMYVSITAIMGVLVVFWGLSIKNSLSQGIVVPGLGTDSQQLINEVQGSMADFKAGITDVTNQNQETDMTNQALEDIKQQIVTDQVKDDIANQLKEKLENLDTNIENTNNTNNN